MCQDFTALVETFTPSCYTRSLPSGDIARWVATRRSYQHFILGHTFQWRTPSYLSTNLQTCLTVRRCVRQICNLHSDGMQQPCWTEHTLCARWLLSHCFLAEDRCPLLRTKKLNKFFVRSSGHLSSAWKLCNVIFCTGLGRQAKMLYARALHSMRIQKYRRSVWLAWLLTMYWHAKAELLTKVERPNDATVHDRLYSEQAAKEAATHSLNCKTSSSRARYTISICEART